VDAAKELTDKWGGAVAIASASPAGSLIVDLRDRNVPIVEVSTSEQAAACGRLYDAVVDTASFRHRTQPHLEVALRGAERRAYGDAWLWSRRRSTTDISPLVAVTLACGQLKALSDISDNVW
jgi:hypothetical protein